MTVPISGRFNMFPLSNSTSIQGSVDAGGGTVPDDSDFDTIIAQSTVSYFHPTYAGNITALSQVSSSLQYRGYPHIVTAASIKYASFQGSACTATSSTYYINTTSSTRFDLATIIWSNSAGTTFANAGWYSNGTIRRYWNGSAFTTTVNCGSNTPVRSVYYITGGNGIVPSDFQVNWCGGGGTLLSTAVYNESSSNVAGTTDKTFYTSATGTGTYSGGGSGKYYCISTISGQNTKTIVSKQYTVINSSGVGLDAGLWSCGGDLFPY